MGKVGSYDTASGLTGSEEITLKQSAGVTRRAAINDLKVKATGGTTARTLADWMAGALDVEAFGAVGDGVTDDTAAFVAALATGRPIRVPEASVAYLIDAGNLTIPTGTRLIGDGPNSKVTINTTTLNPLFDLEDNTDISIEGLWLAGNSTTQLSASSGSSAISCDDGAERITIKNCRITNWTRHGIALDGVTDALIEGNIVKDTYRGSGILCSRTVPSDNVSVINNTVRRSQSGNIHAFFGVRGWRVTGNFCDGTDTGVGGALAVADNITAYSDYGTGGELTDVAIVGNLCLNSGNNGMHIGGDRITITGNTVVNPVNGGIFCAKSDNVTPEDSEGWVVADNYIVYSDNSGAGVQRGINLRNAKNYSITGNTVVRAAVGIEINGLDTTSYGVATGTIIGNTVDSYSTYGIWLRNKVQGAVISNNRLNADAAETTTDIREDLASAVSADNFIFNNITSNADSELVQMIRAYGNGQVALGNQNGKHFEVGSTTANVVNNIQISGNSAGSAAIITVEGSDTNIGISIAPKGTGIVTSSTFVSDVVGRLQAMPRSTTAALEAVGDAINTTNKFANKAVINTTTGAIVTANAAAAADVWLALDGTTAHTPV